MATVRDYVRKPPSEAPGPAHPCDDPSLSALDFLFAVMRDRSFPISVRMDAASRLLPLTKSVPRAVTPEPRCTIVIGGLPTEDQDRITQNDSHFSPGSHIAPRPSDDSSSLLNLTRYTDPPTPEEILEIKAAVQRLCPDADVSQVPEPRLCACGHWMFYPCNCSCSARDPSKLN
jgi:hypothetical protein